MLLVNTACEVLTSPPDSIFLHPQNLPLEKKTEMNKEKEISWGIKYLGALCHTNDRRHLYRVAKEMP